MNRSKRLLLRFPEPPKVGWEGQTRSPPRGRLWVLPEQLPLLHPAVLRLLRLTVAPHGLRIVAHRRHKIPPGPAVFPHKIPLPPPLRPGTMNGALPLQLPSHLRPRLLGGNPTAT